MKPILAVLTLALVTLAIEEVRQVAGEAHTAYGEAVDQARDATETLSRNVKRQPLSALLMAGALGYVLAWLMPLR